jgi:hypothetical protein
VAACHTPPDPPQSGLSRLTAQAVEDLARRLRVPSDDVDVLEARAVVWPDASCGCPRPGMRFKQVPVDGALIRLAAEGRTFEYHSGAGGRPFLCVPPSPPIGEPRGPVDLKPRDPETDTRTGPSR